MSTAAAGPRSRMLRVRAAPSASAGATAPKVIVAASALAVSNFEFIACRVYPVVDDCSQETQPGVATVPSSHPRGPNGPAQAPHRGGRTGRAVQIESLIRAIPDFPIPGIL